MITYTPFAALKVSADNVRTYDPATDEKLDVLIASILAVGLIAPLCIDSGDLIVAGQRRYHAIKQIRTEHKLFDEVPTIRIPDELATDISLAENYAREQLGTVDLYDAFAKVKAAHPERTDEQIGAMFGYDGARVKRIMRLALLHPDIMAAWRDGQLDEKQAQAFAAEPDIDKQRSAFETVMSNPNSWQRGAYEIKRALKFSEHEDRKRLERVGVAAYEAAGGTLTRDLFTSDVRIDDTALLLRLATEKEAAELLAFASSIRRPGVKVPKDATAEEAMALNNVTIGDYENMDWSNRVTPKAVMTKAQEKKRAELVAAKEAVESDGTEEDYDAATDALDAFDEALPTTVEGTDPIIVCEGHGSFYVWRAEAPAAIQFGDDGEPLDLSEQIAARTDGRVDHAAIAKQEGLTKDGYVAMQAVALASRVAVMESGDVANLWTFLQIRERGDYHTFHNRDSAIVKAGPADLNTKQRELLRDVVMTPAANGASTFDPGELLEVIHDKDIVKAWDAWNMLPTDARQHAMDWVMVTQFMPAVSTYNPSAVNPIFAAVAAEVAQQHVNCTEGVERNEAFFELFSHKRRQRIFEEVGLAHIGRPLKKDTSAKMLALLFSITSADDETAKLHGIDADSIAAMFSWEPEGFRA